VGTDAAGTRKIVFFDFDDAGPGFLAYALSVLPWSYLFRKSLKEPDDALRERWMHYLRGYRAGGGKVDWLQKQVEVFEAWKGLGLRA
jgi:hypothetical protein